MTPPLQSLALLLLRVVVGVTFFMHGKQKLGDLNGTEQFFNSLGIPVPALMAPLVAVTETVGGIMLILGLLTPLASLGVISTMLVAITTVHLKAGHAFVGAPGKPSYETAAGYLAIALLMLLTGPGAYSLDALIFGRGTRPAGEGARTTGATTAVPTS